MLSNRIPYANRWGFGYYDERLMPVPPPNVTERMRSYVFPYWLVLLIVAVLLAIAI